MIILILLSSFIFTFISTFCFLSRVPKRRLQKIDQVTGENSLSYKGMLLSQLKVILKPLADINKRLKLTSYRLGLENKLRISGIGRYISDDEFIALKELSLISCFAVCLLAFQFQGSNLILSLPFVALAFFGPDLWLYEITVNRRRGLITALPGMIDLMILCIGAGIDLVSAIDRIVKESKSGTLKDELQEFISEIRIGISRREALTNLAYRTGIPDMNSFVAALSQADALGSSLVPILRVQADQLRDKRAQKAEKMAVEAPIKMLFPILLFIFPVVFIMLLAPIIIESIQALKPF